MEIGPRICGKSQPIKASWKPSVHKIFVDLCVKEVLKGNKPGTHFTKDGWRNIEESFYRKSGLRYEKKQLKNHWDNIKDEWKIWRKLIETGSMKWDPSTRRFGASEEDWAEYIKTNPGASKYRHKELLFAGRLNVVYGGTSYMAETKAPAHRRKLNDASAATFLHTNEPGAIIEFELEEAMRPDSRALFELEATRNEHIFDSVESKSIITMQSAPAKLSYSIGECIDCLDTMEDVIQGSDLYLFALDIFLKKEYREIFLNLKKPSVRIAWLERLQSGSP